MNKPLLVGVALCLTGCVEAMIAKSAYDYDIDPSSKLKDDRIEITIDEMQAQNVFFRVKNNASSSAKIIWDEVSIVDTDGNSHRVIHNGVRLVTAGEAMPPTSIPPAAVVRDAVGYADGVQGFRGTWTQTSLAPCGSAMPGQLCSRDEHYGKTLTVLFTVESGGQKREYIAKLKLKKRPQS